MYEALVIADDMTGATDTGQQFATRGYTTKVTAQSQSNDTISNLGQSTEVLVVDTDSRTSEESTAYDAVSSVIDCCPAATIYKKVDSTLRGNVLPEIEAVLDQTSSDIVVIAPAFPANDRVTVGGYHLVDERPITSAMDYQARESPPTTSHIPTLLRESAYPVTHIPIEIIDEGADATAAELDAISTESPTLAVCDALSARHLDVIATAAERVGTDSYVGSAGLAAHVELSNAPTTQNRVLGVVGSTNERTLSQLSALPDDWVTYLDLKRALSAPEAAGRETGQHAERAMQSSNIAVIASIDPTNDIDAYRLGSELGYDEMAVRSRIGTALTTAAEECWQTTSPTGLFATGGTVAKQILDRLDIDTIELTGQEVEAGIPVAQFDNAAQETVRLVTKAGGFGDAGTILNCLDSLRRI
ncbi:four-carbon acid sugar kinase family protein [Haloarcula amylovorans]|uniref:four-carbon acid sugar kinase family protein n=1 Tax=Haloarcula amylovorans TaxID=2562280 RepID=UPI00107647E6|nr:four-carbon acid sugar kinase family protein [Halomicroarcula amylolytica]